MQNETRLDHVIPVRMTDRDALIRLTHTDGSNVSEIVQGADRRELDSRPGCRSARGRER